MNPGLQFAVCMIVFLWASISTALDESQLPEDWFKLIGQWQTPRGSIVNISADSPGALRGYLEQVSTDAAAAGFNRQDLALDAGELVGDQIFFRVAVRPEDPGLQSCPIRYQEFKGVLSDGKLVGQIRKARFEGCELKLLEGFEALEYTRLPIDCVEPPKFQIFHIRRVGVKTDLTFGASSENPLGPEDAFIAARLEAAGRPFPEALIHWKIEDKAAGVETVWFSDTGADGIARLEFIMLPDGSFAPRNQINMRPTKVVLPGTYTIKATAPYLDLKESIEYTVTFKRTGGQIRFLDITEGINFISELFLPEESDFENRFALEVFDWGSNPNQGDIAVNLTSYTEGGSEFETTTVELKKQKSPGVYNNVQAPVRVYSYPGRTKGFLRGVFEGDLFRKRLLRTANEGVTEIRAEVQLHDGKAQAALRVYKSEEFAAWDMVKGLLEAHQKAIDELRAAAVEISAEQHRILSVKERMIRRALEILKDPRLAPNDFPRAQFMIAGQYLEFLKINDLLNPRRGSFMFNVSLLGGTQLAMPYETQAEQMALERAQKIYQNAQQRGLEPVADELIAKLRNAPSEIFETAKLSLTYLVGSPFFSGYLLVFGLTMEGEEAETVDYILAGIDVGTFLIQSPTGVHVKRQLAQKKKIVAQKRKKRQRIAKRHRKPRPRTIQGEKLPAGFQEVVPYDLLRFNEGDIDWILRKWDEVGMPDDLKQRQFGALARIWDSKLIGVLRERIEGFKGGLRWSMGLMEHWVKQLELKAHLDHLVAKGQAELVETGRYRFLDGREELVEWTIPGTNKRIDHGFIDPGQGEIRINDIAAGPNKEHWIKGQGYAQKIKERFPDYGVKYCEYEWSEKSAKLIESRTFRF